MDLRASPANPLALKKAIALSPLRSRHEGRQIGRDEEFWDFAQRVDDFVTIGAAREIILGEPEIFTPELSPPQGEPDIEEVPAPTIIDPWDIGPGDEGE